MGLSLCARVLTLTLITGLNLLVLAPPLRAQEGPELSIPRVGVLTVPTQMHGTAVIGQRLYLIGGETQEGWSNSVASAPIAADGRIGSWRTESPLPVRLAYIGNSIEVLNNRIYLIGGITATRPDTRETSMVRSRDILWTETGPDGSLRPWKKSPPFPGPHLGFMATASTDRHLLVTGGSTSQGVFNSLYVADFAPDGEPVNWRSAGKLPIRLCQHGAAVQGDRIYVWGGLKSRKNSSHITLDPADINTRVWSAPLNGDGTVGAWREEAPMPAPTFGSACSGFNDYLVNIGGRYQDKRPTNGIWFAHLENGRVGEWKFVKTDLEARVYHSLGLDQSQGRIFVTGGQKKTAPGNQPIARLNDIQAFQIPQPEGSRLSAVQVAAGGQTETGGGGGSGEQGFLPLREALRHAASQRRPVLAFFYSPEVPGCRRFWDSVISTPAFQALKQNFILSAVDVSGPDASLGPEYHIFKVPALVVIGPDGKHLKSTISLRTMEDVTRFVSQ